jgi:uncharacterized membrane protein YeiB
MPLKNEINSLMATSLPIQQKERVVIVDALRGFALFGVLM